MLYCNARKGLCRTEPDGEDSLLAPLFEQIVTTVPPPSYDPEMPLQFLITSLAYDDYVGRLAIGRIFSGYDGLARTEIAEAGPGDIVAIAGLSEVAIGETLSSIENPQALPQIRVEEPTIAMVFSINNSPMSGREGTHVTSRKLKDRLAKELLTNVAIRVEETDSADAMKVSASSTASRRAG